MIHFEYVNEMGRHLAETIERENLPFEGEALVFVGALGICVRKIQSLVHDKYTDPAVICVDSTGAFVIPVLSGHIGGANQLARQIARVTGGVPVITTQSDNTSLWALDTLARTNGWQQIPLDRQQMNQTIAAFVNCRPTALILEWQDAGTKKLEETLPSHVTLFRSWTDYRQSNYTFDLEILVSPQLHGEDSGERLRLQFLPPCLHLGVGCQKQTTQAAAQDLLQQVEHQGYARQAIASIATIQLKRDEPLLHELQRLLPWASTNIYSADSLAKIPVPHPSQHVEQTTGSPSVAEAAALAQSTMTQLIVDKQKGTANDGKSYTWALSITQATPRRGHVEFVGAGPGDPELLSIRGRRMLEQADLILFAGSLVPRQLTDCAKAGAVVRSSAGMNLEEQIDLMRSHYDKGHLVVRLHTGDPCIYGAIEEQMALLDTAHINYHITPGISSFQAAAAELRSQFTIPEKCQTIILTRGEGRTPMPDGEKLHQLAVHRSTMCIFLSATLVRQVQQELLAGGYPPSTPVAVCHKLTWPEQQIWRGTLDHLADLVEKNQLTLTTLLVVGDAIDNRHGSSQLYDHQFSHLYRQVKREV